MQPNLKVLGQKVRDARHNMGLTQQQLSERVDCSPEWISKIERGRASPSLSCINTIGHILGVDLTVLLSVERAQSEVDVEGWVEYATSLVRALNDDYQGTAIYLIEALLRRQRELEFRSEIAEVS